MSRRSALTLVELLASLAIVTMLVVAALGVTTSLARSQLAIRRQDEATEGPAPGLAALVEADLVHAHHWRPVEGGFAVQATVRLAPGTLRLEHVPAVVTYRIVEVDDRPYLVRREETPPEPPRTELVAVGAARVALVPAKDVRPNRYGWKAFQGGGTVRVALQGKGGRAHDVSVPIGAGGPN